jgi:hypothetical protein
MGPIDRTISVQVGCVKQHRYWMEQWKAGVQRKACFWLHPICRDLLEALMIYSTVEILRQHLLIGQSINIFEGGALTPHLQALGTYTYYP